MHLTTVVQLGTKNMINKGMLARVTVNIHSAKDVDPLFEINNVLVRKAKEGDELWVAMPSERFTIQTENGEETRWKAIVKVGPKEGKRGGETPTPDQDKFTNFILRKYREALEVAKQEQTAQAPEPAAAPADDGEPEF